MPNCKIHQFQPCTAFAPLRNMARKKLEYSDIYPFHIYGKSNNSEWFYIPIQDCWRIFTHHLIKVEKKYNLKIHAFVLMNNHYHMIASTPDNNLSKIMNRLITGVSKSINAASERSNHVFGGQYRATIIKNEHYYLQAIRYVYQNPIAVNLCSRVDLYPYSTIKHSLEKNTFNIPIANNEIFESVIESDPKKFLDQMNNIYSAEQRCVINKAMKRKEYKLNKRVWKKIF